MSDERWVEERLRMEAAGLALPPRQRWTPVARRSPSALPATLAATALVVVIALGIGAGLRSIRTGGDSAATAAPTATVSPTAAATQRPPLPSDWTLHVGHRVILAVPSDWGGPEPIETTPPHPILGYLLFPEGHLMVTIWEGEAEQIVEDRFVRGNLQPITRTELTAPRRAIELVSGGITWRDPVQGQVGSYEARHLFIQLTPTLVADVSMTPIARVPSRASELTAEERRVQDEIALYLHPVVDTQRALTHAEVEAALSGTLALQRQPPLPGHDVTSGDERVYKVGAEDSFVYVSTYPDQAARQRDDPNEGGGVGATIGWISPVSFRGIGNVLVIVGSPDPNVRYQALLALDALLDAQ